MLSATKAATGNGRRCSGDVIESRSVFSSTGFTHKHTYERQRERGRERGRKRESARVHTHARESERESEGKILRE